MARGHMGAGQTVETRGAGAQGGPCSALTGSFLSARKHTCSERRARAQCAGAWRPQVACWRLSPDPWHPRRMPCASAAAPRPPAGLKAAQSANESLAVGTEGVRAAETHRRAGKKRLSVAGMVVSMPLRNADAKDPEE